MRPVVLVTPDVEESHPAKYFLKRAYAEAVEAAGGLPLIVTYGENVLDYLTYAHAVVVTGGAFDIPPEDYGEARTDKQGPEKRGRTQGERALLEAAIARGLPVLGVCGGMQLLNVVRGGTLHQDIRAEIHGARDHEQKPPEEPAHPIVVEPGSHVFRALGGEHGQVNTTHHQAVKRPGRGLVVTARADDGVIEAIEDPTARFVVGVQWHPETLAGAAPWNLGLYRALVAAAHM